jgi:hypothetical protein
MTTKQAKPAIRLNIKSFNLKQIELSAILLLFQRFPDLPFEKKAEKLGISPITLNKRCADLGIEIPKGNRRSQEEFFEQLDKATLNTNIVFRGYALTTVRSYVCSWCAEHRDKIRYAVSEIKDGVCVYLYKRS